MVHEVTEQRPGLATVSAVLIWLGGGYGHELGERHERSAHAVSGAVVAVGAVLAWLAATLAVTESARWPILAVAPLALVFGLLAGAVTHSTVAGPRRSRAGVVGRAAAAAAVGVIVGELAALVILSGSIDQRLDERALSNAESAPSVSHASASLQQSKEARAALDGSVAQARERQDKALVVARCEYHPTPGCPQTRITGVPGAGPETRTANELLTDAQHELDAALAARDSRAPELDAAISRQEQALHDARRSVMADAGRDLGTRWVTMNDLASGDAGVQALRLLTIGACALLYLAPLILGLWRGQTTHDRHATARAERDRAELDADTAIAIKRAEVRREAEIMWAEHQLTQARLAIDAQTEIDRERQRRRVLQAVEKPVHASSQRAFDPGPVLAPELASGPVSEPAGEDVYLPIAAEAEAASRAITQRLTPQPGGEVEPHEERSTPLVASLPEATKAAARWIRPLVPPFVARVIDTTTQPLRTARHVFQGVLEETEEITFALRRTRKVTVNSEATDAQLSAPGAGPETTSARAEFVTSSRHGTDAGRLSAGEHHSELTTRHAAPELGRPDGPRELPPAR